MNVGVKKRKTSRARTVDCSACGNAFQTTHSQGKYCSPPCARAGERKSWRNYGDRNRDERRRYQRQYYRQNKTAVTEKIAVYRKTSAGKRSTRIKDERQRKKYPERYAARQAVLVALRKGVLTKGPCVQCGCRPTQAHHEDYSKPLAVMWLCAPCHRNEHLTTENQANRKEIE